MSSYSRLECSFLAMFISSYGACMIVDGLRVNFHRTSHELDPEQGPPEHCRGHQSYPDPVRRGDTTNPPLREPEIAAERRNLKLAIECRNCHGIHESENKLYKHLQNGCTKTTSDKAAARDALSSQATVPPTSCAERRIRRSAVTLETGSPQLRSCPMSRS